jgi:hypothetical protein
MDLRVSTVFKVLLVFKVSRARKEQWVLRVL